MPVDDYAAPRGARESIRAEAGKIQPPARQTINFTAQDGVVDTNVFFQDTVRLVQRLIELRLAEPRSDLLAILASPELATLAPATLQPRHRQVHGTSQVRTSGAHGLRGRLTPDMLAVFETGVRFTSAGERRAVAGVWSGAGTPARHRPAARRLRRSRARRRSGRGSRIRPYRARCDPWCTACDAQPGQAPFRRRAALDRACGGDMQGRPSVPAHIRIKRERGKSLVTDPVRGCPRNCRR